MKNHDLKRDKHFLDNVEGIKIPFLFPRVSFFIFLLLAFAIACMFLPWIQTAPGMGVITALNPADRVQKIVAPVTGRIDRWFVQDGFHVKKGDKIALILDIDPLALTRLQNSQEALKQRLEAIQGATSLAKKNFIRQEKLYAKGLSSRKEFEMSEITYQRSLSDEKYYHSQLIKAEGELSKQSSQLITAERDGYIVNTLASSSTRIVKAGEFLADFFPDSKDFVAELYVSGNNIPLIHDGQTVRLIFEGWPAVQFTGWPSVSIGTFGGKVAVVDYAASKNGLFRVLVTPDKNDAPWPDRNFLRIGTKLQGVVQMNEVLIGYELWRQMNGFPISVNEADAKKSYKF